MAFSFDLYDTLSNDGCSRFICIEKWHVGVPQYLIWMFPVEVEFRFCSLPLPYNSFILKQQTTLTMFNFKFAWALNETTRLREIWTIKVTLNNIYITIHVCCSCVRLWGTILILTASSKVGTSKVGTFHQNKVCHWAIAATPHTKR